jgi:hypothetical protein
MSDIDRRCLKLSPQQAAKPDPRTLSANLFLSAAAPNFSVSNKTLFQGHYTIDLFNPGAWGWEISLKQLEVGPWVLNVFCSIYAAHADEYEFFPGEKKAWVAFGTYGRLEFLKGPAYRPNPLRMFPGFGSSDGFISPGTQHAALLDGLVLDPWDFASGGCSMQVVLQSTYRQ